MKLDGGSTYSEEVHYAGFHQILNVGWFLEGSKWNVFAVFMTIFFISNVHYAGLNQIHNLGWCLEGSKCSSLLWGVFTVFKTIFFISKAFFNGTPQHAEWNEAN